MDHGKPFSVKSCSRAILEARAKSLFPSVIAFDYACIWKRNTPLKVCFMLWLTVKNRLPVEDRLRKMGFSMASVCSCCHKSAEEVNHVFLHCLFANYIWGYFFGISKLQPVRYENIRALLSDWPSAHFSARGQYLWRLLPHAVIWGLWLERNQRKFEGKEEPVVRVIHNIMSLLWSWSIGADGCNKLHLDDLICNWSSVLGI